jgi:DNA helicase II / ATP-dependent DNA helicase PcrA
VTNVRGRVKLGQHATPEQRILFEQFRALSDRLSAIEAQTGNTNLGAYKARGTGVSFASSASVSADHSGKNSASPSDDSDYISAFEVNERVFHKKFGFGNVTEIDGAKLTVNFDTFGVKRVIDSFIESAKA